MRLPRTRDQHQNDYIRRMTGGTLGGRVRSAAPISPHTRPTRRTVGVTSRKAKLAAWAHFDANELSLNDGDVVSTWADISGNGRDVTARQEGREPIYRSDGINGNPSVDFMPFSSDTLAMDREPVSTEQFSRILTFVVLDAYNIGGDPGTMLYLQRDGFSEYIIMQFFEDDTTARVNSETWDGDNVRNVTSEWGTNVAGGPQIIETLSTSSKLELLVDGTVIGTDTSGTFNGLTPEEEIELGAHNDYDALFGEIVVLKDDQVDNRDQWYSDLASRWSL